MGDAAVKDYCERCYKHCKPEEYILFDYNDNAAWLFELLNIQPGDTFDDLFPGTQAVSRAFERWMHAKQMWQEVAG